MKYAWIAVLALLCSFGAQAQSDTTQGLASVSQERARIDTLRRQQTAVLDAQERECQTRFAVVDCVNKVSAQRRAMLSELKRQDATLNDAERRQRGAEQIKQLEDRAAEDTQRRAEMQASPDTSEDEKRRIQKEKIQQHAKPPAGAASAASGEKTSGPDAAAAAKNRADYDRKQEDALQRKQDRDKRLKEQGTAPAPLPAPP